MEKAINDFPQQFAWQPTIENGDNLKPYVKFIVAGMGGSAIPAQILKTYDPFIDLIIHRDYDLPQLSDKELGERLVIASSYSGGTEETISALGQALSKGLGNAVISMGGKLLELAKEHNLPYIQLPDTGIQPRMATGFITKAMATLMHYESFLTAMSSLVAGMFSAQPFKQPGKELAQELHGSVPVIYASSRNAGLASTWKIKLNETGKIPAFYNVLSELNHNEMTSFDVQDTTRALSEKFYILILFDEADHPQVQKRMDILIRLYKDRGLRAKKIMLQGETPLAKIFSSLLLADWTAFHIAKLYGVESEQVPMVEEFKKLIET